MLKAGGLLPTAMAIQGDKKSLWDSGSNIAHRSRASMRTLVMAVERHDLTAADRSGLSRAGFAGIGSLYAVARRSSHCALALQQLLGRSGRPAAGLEGGYPQSTLWGTPGLCSRTGPPAATARRVKRCGSCRRTFCVGNYLPARPSAPVGNCRLGRCLLWRRHYMNPDCDTWASMRLEGAER
jgi:hypothetical protein